ncbi:MFS transporter [Amaricoccus tamworthensis]|uniref:MFS transporter n=1 Tax=Amaricoccus tamworthensis TaxID=57002 RepID=UPI003C7A359E
MTRTDRPLHALFQILLLWLAGLGAAAQFAKISVIFADIRALYPGVGPELGLLVSLLSSLGIVFGMTAGVILVRVGFRRPLVAALLLGAVVSLWQSTLPGFSAMLVSRVIEGCAHLVIVVAAPTMMARVAPEGYRGVAMTLWGTFFGVAFAVVAWIGLPFVEVHGPAALFQVHAAWMAGVAGLVALGFREPVRSGPAPAPLTLAGVWRQHLRAYASPAMSAPALGWFFYTMTFVSLLTILPEMIPESARALTVGVMPLASIVVSLFGVSALLRVMPATWIILAGFGLSAVLILLPATGLPVAVTGVALFGALGLVQGASFAAVPELNRETGDQALANGAVAQMGNLGNTLGTPFLLIMLAAGGFGGMILAVAGCYLCAVAVHLWLAARRRKAGL